MAEIISSGTNPLVKQIRALRQKKTRDESGLFLVEGIHHVGEAVEAGWELDTLVYSPDLLEGEFATKLVEEQVKKGQRCAALTPGLFAQVAEKENPQGILAIVQERRTTLEEVKPENIQVGAALVSPQDPGNVGTILRTLDAMDGDILFLLEGGVDLYHPSLIRASMGTIFWKPIVRTSFMDFVRWAHAAGMNLAGSSAHAHTDYRELRNSKKPVIVVLGSEQKGLSAEQMKDCDFNVTIPMKGRTSSLNLAVAAGILLYTLVD